MFFIHTFSMIKVFKKREEVEQLWKIYNQKNITEKKVFRINEFSDKGVRLVIRDLEKQRKRFEKVTTEVEIIVTPYKLLHNGEALGRLTTEEEYTEAIKVCERNKALGIQLDIDFMGTYKKTKTILSYFNDLSLSPIPLVSDCPFIPSLFTLIFDSDNTDAYEYLYYAKKHTRGKEYWSYEEYDK